MATAKEVLALIITADGKGAIAEMRKVNAAAKAELGATEAAAKGFSANTSAALIAGGAAAVVAGGATILALKGMSNAYVTAARETTKLQRVTGGTAEDMSRLRYVAAASGVGVDQLSTAFVRLSRSSGTKAGADALKGIGVSMTDAEGKARPMLSVLADISAAFEAMPNGAQKNATVLKVFGRTGADLLPLLNKGADGIRNLSAEADQLGMTLGQADVDGVKEYVKQQRELNAAVQGFQIQVGKSVFPAFAEGLNAATGVVSGLAKSFNSMPDSLQSTIGSMAMLGSSGLIVAGGLAVAIGAGSRLKGAFTDASGAATRMGSALQVVGAAAIALEGVNLFAGWLNDLNGSTAALDNFTKRAIGAKNSVGGFGQFGQAVIQQDEQSGFGQVKNFIGDKLGLSSKLTLGQDVAANVDSAQKVFDNIRQADLKSAQQVLDGFQQVTDGLDHTSTAYRTNTDFIRTNQAALDADKAASDALSQASVENAGATDQMTFSLQAQSYAFEDVTDSAGKATTGAKLYVDGLKGAFDPVFGLMDANRGLADSQKKLAEISSGSTSQVISATSNLADAQQRLNDVLKDDPMFGLKSVSPESELADARQRLADANNRLAANPADSLAMSAKDIAISDMEDASKRAQDDKRTASARASQIASAQRAVADAQKQLSDAKADTGKGSEAYSQAAEDVIKANLKVQEADAALADWLRTHGIAGVGELNAKLDEWIQKGGPLGEAAATLKTQFDPLVTQALTWAAALAQGADTLTSAVGGKITGTVITPFKGGSGGGGGGGDSGRARGGDVIGGVSYRMAEAGKPELFVPRGSGYVIPDISGRSGGSSQPVQQLTINANITQHTSAPETAGAAVIQGLRGIAHRSGKGLRVPV